MMSQLMSRIRKLRCSRVRHLEKNNFSTFSKSILMAMMGNISYNNCTIRKDRNSYDYNIQSPSTF